MRCMLPNGSRGSELVMSSALAYIQGRTAEVLFTTSL